MHGVSLSLSQAGVRRKGMLVEPGRILLETRRARRNFGFRISDFGFRIIGMRGRVHRAFGVLCTLVIRLLPGRGQMVVCSCTGIGVGLVGKVSLSATGACSAWAGGGLSPSQSLRGQYRVGIGRDTWHVGLPLLARSVYLAPGKVRSAEFGVRSAFFIRHCWVGCEARTLDDRPRFRTIRT